MYLYRDAGFYSLPLLDAASIGDALCDDYHQSAVYGAFPESFSDNRCTETATGEESLPVLQLLLWKNERVSRRG